MLQEIEYYTPFSNKVVRFNHETCQNEVAILFSPGFGAGWYSWHGQEQLLFDAHLVNMVQQGMAEDINADVLAMVLGIPHAEAETIYLGGVAELEVAWVPLGEDFRVDDYDGSESITLKSEMRWIRA